jgi:hypothetical protein
MKNIITTIISFTVLFICTNVVHAQNRISFNKYGTYLVQSGMVTEIHTEYETRGAYFWENYLVLEGESTLGCCIYNMVTQELSNWIWGTVMQIERENNLKVYIYLDPHPNRGYWIFEFEYDTLEIKNRDRLNERPFPDLQQSSYLFDVYGEGIYKQRTTEEKINVRLYRYRGKNFYLDIGYGPDIDLTGKYWDYLVDGGRDNIFVVSLHKVLPYK